MRTFRRITSGELDQYREAGWRLASRPTLNNLMVVEKDIVVAIKKTPKSAIALRPVGNIYYVSVVITPPAGWMTILTEEPTVVYTGPKAFQSSVVMRGNSHLITGATKI